MGVSIQLWIQGRDTDMATITTDLGEVMTQESNVHMTISNFCERSEVQIPHPKIRQKIHKQTRAQCCWRDSEDNCTMVYPTLNTEVDSMEMDITDVMMLIDIMEDMMIDIMEDTMMIA